jgi:molybdopterin converting factor small subunit
MANEYLYQQNNQNPDVFQQLNPGNVEEAEPAEVAEKRKKEQEEKTTLGVGTDIFVRKKKPGAVVGSGYIVDIYEQGAKTDSIELSTKQKVVELVRKFKEKYNTDRAFQNELQLHVTFKHKTERGDSVMASIDDILLKKANRLQDVLQRLIDPKLPLKIRQGEEMPNIGTPAPTQESTQENQDMDKESIKRFIANEIIKKFTDFVKEKIETSEIPTQESSPITAQNKEKIKLAEADDLFNPLRKWYGALARKIEEFNQANNIFNAQDIADITNDTKKILLSKDPNLFSQNTGEQISQEVADAIYNIGTKNIGKPGEAEEGGLLGGDPEKSKKEEQTESSSNVSAEEQTNSKTAEIISKGFLKSEDLKNKLSDFTRQIQTVGDTKTIDSIATDLDVKRKEVAEQLYDLLIKKGNLNQSEAIAKRWLEETIGIKKADSIASEFWKYASQTKGEFSLEEVFADWVEKSDLTVDELVLAWDEVTNDVRKAFNLKKEAQINIDQVEFSNVFTNTIKTLYNIVDMVFSGGTDFQTARLNSNIDIISEQEFNNFIAENYGIRGVAVPSNLTINVATRLAEIVQGNIDVSPAYDDETKRSADYFIATDLKNFLLEQFNTFIQ